MGYDPNRKQDYTMRSDVPVKCPRCGQMYTQVAHGQTGCIPCNVTRMVEACQEYYSSERCKNDASIWD